MCISPADEIDAAKAPSGSESGLDCDATRAAALVAARAAATPSAPAATEERKGSATACTVDAASRLMACEPPSSQKPVPYMHESGESQVSVKNEW